MNDLTRIAPLDLSTWSSADYLNDRYVLQMNSIYGARLAV